MQATRTGHSWIIQTENNKEEIALLTFLSEYKHELSAVSAHPGRPAHSEPVHHRPHFAALDLPHDL